MTPEPDQPPPPATPPPVPPLTYRTPAPPRADAPHVGLAVVICVIYGLLALFLLGVGGLAVAMGLDGQANAAVLLPFSLLFFALAGLLIYWSVWYVNSLRPRR